VKIFTTIFLFDDSRDGSHFTAAEITVTHVEGEDTREWDEKPRLGGTQPHTHQKKHNRSRTCFKRRDQEKSWISLGIELCVRNLKKFLCRRF
jgi:hypothetical protein